MRDSYSAYSLFSHETWSVFQYFLIFLQSCAEALQNHSATCLPEFWCCLRGFMYIPYLCLQKHIFWEFTALRGGQWDLWCTFSSFLDFDYHPSLQVHYICVRGRWQRRRCSRVPFQYILLTHLLMQLFYVQLLFYNNWSCRSHYN